MPYPDSEYPSILRGKDKRESQRLLAAAPEMLAALKQAVKALNVARRFAVGDTDSYAIASLCDAAISKAEGRADETTPD